MSKIIIPCAIYTRKSSEEGLEQDFNSLDAQREACAAYVLSQQHEGWRATPICYDDGGYSGGNMDRPALKKLLEDISEKDQGGCGLQSGPAYQIFSRLCQDCGTVRRPGSFLCFRDATVQYHLLDGTLNT